MFPRADHGGELGLSLVELIVGVAIASLLVLGLWTFVRSTVGIARQNDAKSDSSEQVATLLRRIGDAVSAMERGGQVVVGQKGVTFVTKVLRDGAARSVLSTLKNQCVPAKFVGFEAAAVAASPAWRACAGAPRCSAGTVPSIVFEGPFARAQTVPAPGRSTVAAQRLIGAYFCASSSSPDQALLTVVDVRTGEAATQALVTGQRTIVLGYNTRLSERIQLFIPAGGKK